MENGAGDVFEEAEAGSSTMEMIWNNCEKEDVGKNRCK